MDVIAYNRTPRARAPCRWSISTRCSARRRGVDQSAAQRRNPRLPRQGAHRAHEAGGDPGQYRARRAHRRGRADRSAQSGHIRHAGLDVFEAEPLKADHPLAKMQNVTLTSHAAFRTLEASMTLLRRAIDIVKGLTLFSSNPAWRRRRRRSRCPGYVGPYRCTDRVQARQYPPAGRCGGCRLC